MHFYYVAPSVMNSETNNRKIETVTLTRHYEIFVR